MTDLPVKWTGPAAEEIATFTADQTENTDPKTWHEEKVRAYAAQKPALQAATQAKIRKPAHKGGTDPNEAEHITVTYKSGQHEISSASESGSKGGAWHVYTQSDQ